jgi:CheY-like chemotaxis protein
MIDVLVVDDDALMRGLVAEWLIDAGYRVRQAENGTNALQMLRSRPAGLLITDMDMPGRDGAQTLDEARRMLPGLPVIAISGGARDGKQNWAATALKLGAAKALAKPFERQDLLAAVEEVVPRDKSGAVRV